MTQQITSKDLQQDGIHSTGSEFSRPVASGGFEFITRSDYPAEIRAPAGSLYGVSAYQIQYSNKPVFTSGEDLDVLVAMDPAATASVRLPFWRPGLPATVSTSCWTPSVTRRDT